MRTIISDPRITNQLEKIGISVDEIKKQHNNLVEGFLAARLVKPSTVDDGIISLSEEGKGFYINKYQNSLDDLKVCKFVPASGAASRMFRDLVSEYSNMGIGDEDLSKYPATKILIESYDKFAFSTELRAQIDSLNNYKEVLKTLLFEPGLNYSNLPKGLIKFHDYIDFQRTAFEEHLVEAKRYIKGANGICRIHFTVPEDSRDFISNHIKASQVFNKSSELEFDISYSRQDPSTDTVAIDMENNLILDEEGQLLFRPAGHGALLNNLNKIKADIVFIKNIDNVPVEKYLDETENYKKALGGYLLEIREKIINYLNMLDSNEENENVLVEIKDYCREKLFIDISPDFENLDVEEKIEYLHKKLNRPIRICGVVKNEGEPGGGPFWVKDDSGEVSLQIVESAQVDMNSDAQKKIWESSTHFNPVDIVCSVTNYMGEKFNLNKYVDHSAGIVTTKSHAGNRIKALELPGLWNGAMADWITVFIEVPLITFTPVKTVFDLLRIEHQVN